MDIEKILIKSSVATLPICAVEIAALAVVVNDLSSRTCSILIMALELTAITGIILYSLAFAVAYIKELKKRINEKKQ